MRRCSYLLAIAMAVLTLTDLAQAGNREVSEFIAGKLQASGQLRGYDIRVKYEDGTAWLRGRVATQQQMAAALALAFRAEGVEQVVNGLTVRAEVQQRSRTAPVASPRPVDYAVERARLAAPSTTHAPIPAIQSYPGLSVPPSNPSEDWVTETIEIGDHSPVTLTMTVAANAVEPTSAVIPEAPSPVAPLRRPSFTRSPESFPATAQKACYLTTSGNVHVTDLRIATTLAGAAEPMLLPDESAVSAGEAFASDGSGDQPVLLATSGGNAASPVASPMSLSGEREQPRLIQSLPEPTRRIWAGNFVEPGLPTMRASVDRSR